MQRSFRVWGLAVLAYGALGWAPFCGATEPDAAITRTYQQQGWWVAETANFRVCALTNSAEAARIARHCEALRASIRDLWLAEAADAPWSPRCDIIAHASDAGYLRAVGRGGEQTAGSALIEFGKDDSGIEGVKVRRVDLRAAAREALESALAHELTHVVLADRFANKPIPRWADEGMAVLADSRAKQRLHWNDLQHGLRSRSTIRLAELVGLQDYPSPHRVAVFYGQSASLVSYLLAQGERGEFVAFIKAAQSRGYDQALRDVYQIAGVGELEQRWLASLNGKAEFVSATPSDFPQIAAADPATVRPGT